MHDVLAEIQHLARLDRIELTRHARDRMREREIEYGDVRAAVLTARTATWQSDRGTWRIDGGVDLAGESLVVIVDLAADLLIIPVF